MSHWGPDRCTSWSSDAAAFGQSVLFDTPEAVHDLAPTPNSTATVLAVEARLDNRDELCEALEIPGDARQTIADSTVLRFAYERWGERCPGKLLGDWSFAAWHPGSQRLFLARDQTGQTALFYSWNGRRLAFASDYSALLALPSVSRRLNEYQLALRLVAALGESSGETVYADIHQLLPAHSATIADSGIRATRYWNLNDAPELRLRGLDDYAEGLKEQVERSVATRLRTQGPIGLTLSGGLDSGSVAAVAAPILHRRNGSLTAFTSVPMFDPVPFIGPGVEGNELARASAAIRRWDCVDHIAVDSRSVSPVQGARRMVSIYRQPTISVANQYWLVAILEEARRRGVRVLLTGQHGNHAMSWPGLASLRTVLSAIAARSPRRARIEFASLLKARWGRKVRWDLQRLREQWKGLPPWEQSSLINREFAGRIRLAERMRHEGVDPSAIHRIPSGPAQRALMWQSSSYQAGERWARLAAAHGFVARDPTADLRLVMFAHRIPEHLWRGPLDRWVLRWSLRESLPDDVNFASTRGRQAADLVHRISAHPDEVWSVVRAAKEASTAAEYLDLPRLESLARRTVGEQATDKRTALSVDAKVLMRGVGHAIFLTQAQH